MAESTIPEEYAALVQALGADAQLREWFAALPALPANRRYSELGRLSLQLHEAGQQTLARVIKSLNDEHIYRMVRDVTQQSQR